MVLQSDEDLKALSEQPHRRSLPRDRRVRARMSEQMNREPTPEELAADKAYWDENPELFKKT